MDAVFRSIVPALTAPRARVAAWMATLAVLAVAMLIVGRRLMGAFSERLTLGPLVATLVAALTVLAAARLLLPPHGHALAERERVALAWCGTFALLALCLGCAPPSLTSFQWLAWVPLLAIEYASRMRLLAPPVELPPDDGPELRSVAPAVPHVVGADPDDQYVLQELIRTRTADGVESIRGTLRAEFIAGQRHATLHVGFCPPLERLPEMEVDLVDGPDATVKVTQALAHGATFELRLAEPAEEASRVVVEFSATPLPGALL
jgi:hypothetical protein